MYNRSSLISLANIALTLVALVGTAVSTTVSADTDELQPTAEFSFETSRSTEVDIALASTGGERALISIYSEGDNGLRLLQNAFTDVQGRFVGDMQLPAHLDRVVVVVRTSERQDTLDLRVGNQLIAYAE